MFERFSEPARQAIVNAHEAARALGHPFIAPEHLLLGLVEIGAAGPVSQARVTEEVVAALGPPAGETGGQIPFTPAAQRSLERSFETGEGTTTPAHVLRALLEIPDVAAIAKRCGIDVGDVEPRIEEEGGDALGVTIGDELIGDLGNPRTDVNLIGAILRRDGRAAAWLRTAGIDEAWVREFGGSP